MRELFEQEPPPPPRKTRAELMKDIDADYYGYRDDDDGILTPLEQNEERRGDNAVHSYSQALPSCCISCILEGPALVEFCTALNWACGVCLTTFVYTRGSSLNPNCQHTGT